MTDDSPCFAALTEENRSYLRSFTTVISRFSLISPFSRYCRGVPFPIEQDPYVGVSALRCFRIGDAVDITEFVSHVTARLLHREKATAESMNALVSQIKQQYYEDFQKELLPEIDTFVAKHVNSFIEGKP